MRTSLAAVYCQVICFVALSLAPKRIHGWVTRSITTIKSRTGLRKSEPRNPRYTVLSLSDASQDEPFSYSAEVVGASNGSSNPMGSFWLCHGTPSGQAAAVVPNGISPGYLSAPGSPIYITTASSSWETVWDRVPDDRKQDCVFCSEDAGIPPKLSEAATHVVPHFELPTFCSTQVDDELCVLPWSPKTIVYGKHAAKVAEILDQHGVETEIVENYGDILAWAGKKLLWESCLWLVCNHAKDPITPKKAHLQYREIDRLIDELVPALERLAGKHIDRKSVHEYLEEYSLSQKDDIPDKDFHLSRLAERNGVWLKLATKEYPQKYHKELLQDVVGEKLLEELKNENDMKPKKQNVRTISPKSIAAIENDNESRAFSSKKLDLRALNLVAWGEKLPSLSNHSPSNHPRHIIVVGGGIVGSATALFLAERLRAAEITVLDQEESPLGNTTPASWAWLNANNKSPKSYQNLNQLGIHAWKHETHISSLPSWMGSLVRFEDVPSFVKEGGYPAEGPLTDSEIKELEPFANWTLSENNGATFHFPDEACVDPSEAVQVLRHAAEELGVVFQQGHSVKELVRDPKTRLVTGIISQVDGKEKLLSTDFVVSAAGTGVASACLGGVPMLDRPGQIAYTKSDSTDKKLSKILVDPQRSSHLLQRKDGTLVAGGGVLEVGGSSGATQISSKPNISNEDVLLDGARQLAPELIDDATFDHTSSAVRPMPEDGLPAVGYVAQGLYVIVTHSGITLGPLLADLAAGEIAEHMQCEILAPFRPTRFL